MTATITIIIALSVIVAAIPTIVAAALSLPPRQPDPATGRTSALIGLRGWHGCCIDAAGRTTWVDPVAWPTAAGALTAADAEMRRAMGAPPAVTA